MNITVSEVLAALEKAGASMDLPPNTYSGPEIKSAMRWGAVRFVQEISRMVEHGDCEVVRVRRLAVDGRKANVPAYRFHA